MVNAMKKRSTHQSEQLFEKIQEVDGWDDAVYEAAFADLYQDETAVQFFMAKNINLRRKWMDEFVINRFKRI